MRLIGCHLQRQLDATEAAADPQSRKAGLANEAGTLASHHTRDSRAAAVSANTSSNSSICNGLPHSGLVGGAGCLVLQRGIASQSSDATMRHALPRSDPSQLLISDSDNDVIMLDQDDARGTGRGEGLSSKINGHASHLGQLMAVCPLHSRDREGPAGAFNQPNQSAPNPSRLLSPLTSCRTMVAGMVTAAAAFKEGVHGLKGVARVEMGDGGMSPADMLLLSTSVGGMLADLAHLVAQIRSVGDELHTMK